VASHSRAQASAAHDRPVNVHSAVVGWVVTVIILSTGAFPRAVDADDPPAAGFTGEVNVLQHPVQGGGDAGWHG